MTYLGCLFIDSWDHSIETKDIIEKVRSKNLLCSLNLNLKTRICSLRCYAFSTLLYGVETWILTNATQRKVKAFKMWCYRRIRRIPSTSHTTNMEVDRNNETVKQRKTRYFGYIMKNDKYRTLQLKRKIEIKNDRTKVGTLS